MRATGGRNQQEPENTKMAKSMKNLRDRRKAPITTPTDLGSNARKDIANALNAILADTFALYLKTKNFHWHVSGPHFRDYHLLLDEQGDQIFGTTDELAERVRKIGGRTVRSIGHIAKLQRIRDNDAEFVDPDDMLQELMRDNKAVVHSMREAHDVADKHGDIATASILENFIDDAEKRVWFLFEASRAADETGH
jgi:starvation-inducible DNA-binding protein